MKSIVKVLLAGVAVVGIAKAVNGKKCSKKGCANKRFAMMDKIRNMDETEYSQLKEDIKNRNFKKVREQMKSASKEAQTKPEA